MKKKRGFFKKKLHIHYYKIAILCASFCGFFASHSAAWNQLQVAMYGEIVHASNYDETENVALFETTGEQDYVEDGAMLSAADILSENSIYTEVDQQQEDLTVDDWRLVLVNKQHSIPEDYEMYLGSISTSKGVMKCDERIIPDLMAMLQAADDEQIHLNIVSPYRSEARQEYLFNRKVSTYIRQGKSYMEAYTLAAQAVTIPGSSEHQIGLALDIVGGGYSLLNEGFADSVAGKWLAEHSYEYGFVVRYPKGKEQITGIEYEPWHFRYVGKVAAMQMVQKDLCLEEFVEELDTVE